MGLSLIPKNNGEHPKEIYNYRIYLAAVCAAAAAIMIGYDSAFFGTSISLTSFKQEFGWTKKSAKELAALSANIVTIYQLGAFAGAALAYPMAYFAGRKGGMVFAAMVTVLGAGLMCGADSKRGDGLIFAGRAIAGVGVGTASSIAPLYLGEVSPAPIRGQLIGFYEIGWQIGGLVGFWINYAVQKNIAVSRTQWLVPFAVQLIPAGLFAATVPFFSPESPRWLMQRGKNEKALKNLSYLRKLPADHPYIQEEVAQIQASIDSDIRDVGVGAMAPIKGIFTRWFLTRRLLLTTSLFIFQNGTGINAVNYYSPTFFKSIGLTGERTPLLTTGVFGVIKTIGALLWAFWWVDQYGRKAVLVVGSVGGAIGMLAIAGILGATNPAGKVPAPTKLPASGGAAVAFFYIWTAFYAIGWNGTPWVVNSESFPGSVRLVSSTAGAMSNWLWNFVIARATPSMFLNMGHSGYGVYMFFGLMQVISIAYVIFLLPETKGIPLEYMDTLFEKYKGSPITAHRKTREEIDNAHVARDQQRSDVDSHNDEVKV